MAKAKKRSAVRKKSSKRRKRSTKPVRKMAAKRATSKRTKSKVQPPEMRAKKFVAKKKRPAKAEKRPVAGMSVETTTIVKGEEDRMEDRTQLKIAFKSMRKASKALRRSVKTNESEVERLRLADDFRKKAQGWADLIAKGDSARESPRARQ